MKLRQIKDILNLKTLVPGDTELEIKSGCGSDLLSDVLAFSQQKTLLLTGLTNPQVVRTAEMIGIKVIIFVRGKKPQTETIELAEEKEIALYGSAKSLFESCGLLYENGLKPEKMRQI
ncbi:MAG: hypothetical protein ACOC4G_05110 [Bacillota bacterium]